MEKKAQNQWVLLIGILAVSTIVVAVGIMVVGDVTFLHAILGAMFVEALGAFIVWSYLETLTQYGLLKEEGERSQSGPTYKVPVDPNAVDLPDPEVLPAPPGYR